jgi:LacI family transcriptional regulator
MEPDGILGTLEIDRPVPPSTRARVVILNTTINAHPFGRTVIDDVELGRRAAAHLISRGLPHCAFVGWSTLGFSNDRQKGFLAAMEDASIATSHEVFNLVTHSGELFVPPDQWFADLPKPCGILCANDGLGVRMVNTAIASGFAVPDDLAIMGMNDDELQCIQSPVPLTSVGRDLSAQGLGAAQCLDQWLRRGDAEPPTVVFPPGEVVGRDSTLNFGEPDAIVRRALVIIHTPSTVPITVERLLDRLHGVSRRRLEMRFRHRLGRTPYQEILRTRIEQAKQLLRSTTLGVDEIAFRTGFASSAHFSRPFKARAGITPTEYRRQNAAAVSTDLG